MSPPANATALATSAEPQTTTVTMPKEVHSQGPMDKTQLRKVNATTNTKEFDKLKGSQFLSDEADRQLIKKHLKPTMKEIKDLTPDEEKKMSEAEIKKYNDEKERVNTVLRKWKSFISSRGREARRYMDDVKGAEWDKEEAAYRAQKVRELAQKFKMNPSLGPLPAAKAAIEEAELNRVQFRLGQHIADVFEMWLTKNVKNLPRLQAVTIPDFIDSSNDVKFVKKDTTNMTEEEKKEEKTRRDLWPTNEIGLHKTWFKMMGVRKGEPRVHQEAEIKNVEMYFRYVLYMARNLSRSMNKVTIDAKDVQMVFDILDGICFQGERELPVVERKYTKKATASSSDAEATESAEEAPKPKRKRNRDAEEAAEKKPRKKAAAPNKETPAPKKPVKAAGKGKAAPASKKPVKAAGKK